VATSWLVAWGLWATSLSRSGSVELVHNSDDVGSVPALSLHQVFVATLLPSGMDSACIVVAAQGLCGRVVVTAQGLLTQECVLDRCV